MSLAKLTSQSTSTLSLLLERQRLASLPSGASSNLHLPQISRNLKALRTGILALEARDGNSEAVVLLKSQYERMRAMLPEDVQADLGVERIEEKRTESDNGSRSSTPSYLPAKLEPTPAFHTPYQDDPDEPSDQDTVLQTQRQLMNDQDTHLATLSSSVNRQRDLAIQINDEVDVHQGLLEGLDVDLEATGARISGARRRLDRVAKGIKGNGSTVTIGVLIFLLLILIIAFKT